MLKEPEYRPTAKDVWEMQSHVRLGVDFSVAKGEVSLIWWQLEPKIALVRIVQDKSGHSYHLTEVISASALTVWEAKHITSNALSRRLAPEIVLSHRPTVSLEDSISEIVSFLWTNYPNVNNLPISIYKNERAFREKRALARISLGEAVTSTAYARTSR